MISDSRSAIPTNSTFATASVLLRRNQAVEPPTRYIISPSFALGQNDTVAQLTMMARVLGGGHNSILLVSQLSKPNH